MDEIVRQAMQKWPKVPACFGWLGLDARGNWYMRDEKAQHAGTFASGAAGAKGSLLRHEKLIAFIERNYACDEQGRWYFQNGPQRVFVELEATPWICRMAEDFSVTSHTGISLTPESALLDESGMVYLTGKFGVGLVHTQDVQYAANAVETKVLELSEVHSGKLPAMFGYVSSPQQTA